jgi:exosortase C (VPDSG-CTERM-specific)
LFVLSGLTVITIYFWLRRSTAVLPQDYLALMTLAFLSFFVALVTFIFPLATLKCFAFPFAFLIFMVPFPALMERAVETALQQGSADMAHILFTMSGMPVFRAGTDFRLPGFSMQVAPECSGIHSTIVLIMTSLVAGYLLLRKPWMRLVFSLAVIPLGILRNGFRIFVLGQLCVRLSPDWINSDLHRRGGPIFFALFLVPFFLLLWWLRKWELKKSKLQTLDKGNSND